MASPSPPANAPVAPRCTQTLLLMHEVMRLVAAGSTPDLLMREMLHLLSELLGLHHGRVVMADGGALDPNAPTARIRLAYGLTRAEIARGVYLWSEGVTGRVLATGRAIVVQDIDAEPLFLARAVARAQLPAGPLAFLAVPIENGLRIVGVLACHRGMACERPLEHDLTLLQILATLAGQALQRQDLLLQQLTRTLAPPLVRAYLPARLHSAQELERVLALHDGVQSRAAHALGMTVRQFSYRLRKARSAR